MGEGIAMYSLYKYIRIFVYIFHSLAYSFHSLIKLLKYTFWISKEQNNFSYLWKCEPNILNRSGGIIFEKVKTLQRMYGLDWFLQLSMASISFDIACKELKLAQIAQINHAFQLLNSICAYGDLFYGFTRMLMSKL